MKRKKSKSIWKEFRNLYLAYVRERRMLDAYKAESDKLVKALVLMERVKV